MFDYPTYQIFMILMQDWKDFAYKFKRRLAGLCFVHSGKFKLILLFLCSEQKAGNESLDAAPSADLTQPTKMAIG
jgi:hypothetical protein